MPAAAEVRIGGVVQGVGFRPFVYRLAREMGLAGWVTNTADGVVAHVEGDPAAIDAFPARVRSDAPPMAVVDRLESAPAEPQGLAGFEIRPSPQGEGEMTLVSPDIAMCEACLAEMSDGRDRRFGYPFTNCTNCGPRFTIIRDVPYDRARTTMRDFPMCPACQAEYDDPADRRFHAQPNACHECGPRLYLMAREELMPDGSTPDWEWSADVETVPRTSRDETPERERTAAIVAAAAKMLADGAVLAVKGLGGFHLACDATNEHAVSVLRGRKHRWGKPFAVMFPDIAAAATCCEVSDEEETLLSGVVRPVVLLRALTGPDALDLAPSVAPGLREVGAMLPYTPLHHLLLRAVGRPLVMTSGNATDEPIAMGNGEALTRLRPLADAFLLHDRGIHSRYDDPVTRVVEGNVEMVRRARGYAPFPLSLPFTSEVQILAAGPEQKNTFCLVKDAYAFVSQHIGDMENAETLEHYERTLALYEHIFRVDPEIVAYDLHPEYLSTKLALDLGLPTVGVQHHHAHIVATAAENGVRTPVVGLAFDGTGYGSDGTIWGGEVLVSTWGSFERFAHLKTVPMPGGAAAVKHPCRMAVGLLLGLDEGLFDHRGLAGWREAMDSEEISTLATMARGGVNSPQTSSMGRLFDAVAAMIGVCHHSAYEGQAAIELEAMADESETGAYTFGLAAGEPLLIDPLPVVEHLLDDLASGAPAAKVSARFHNAVADMSGRVASVAADAAGTRHVALGGGVFMNAHVRTRAARMLQDAGLEVLLPRELPFNDGQVSFGQAVVAWARRHEV